MPKNRIHKTKDKRYTYHFTDANGGRHSLMSRKDELKMQFSDRCDDADKLSNNVSFDVKYTLNDLFLKWQTEYQSSTCSQSDITVLNYAYTNYVRTPLGHFRLYEIKRANVYALLSAARNQGLSQSTISKIRACISRPYNWAINILHLDIVNPTVGLIMGSRKSTEAADPIKVISQVEFDRFFAVSENTKHYNYFRLLRETGLRPSEALALRLTDRVNNVLKISRAITKYGPGTLKTDAAYRDIPVTDEIAQILDDQESIINGSPYYFPAASGLPNLNAISICFIRAIKSTAKWKIVGRKKHGELVLPPVKFTLYDFRHTWATTMAEKGMPLKTLQYLMGHSDISVTMKYYIGLTPNALLEAKKYMTSEYSTKSSTDTGNSAKIISISG